MRIWKGGGGVQNRLSIIENKNNISEYQGQKKN